MTRISSPGAAIVFVLLLTLLPSTAAPAPPAAAPDTLADSTVVERWTLENGLRVVTRHIPNGAAVAITVVYASGTDDDPPGREGLAQVLGHLVFTAAAGDIPERTREDLDSQRPYGWSFPVSRRSTLLTEVASVEQFPGVLGQIAGRMRGVQVTPATLQASLRDVRTELGQQLSGPVQVSLYQLVRDVALDRKTEEVLRRASGRDLSKLSVAEVQQQVARTFVPANAVLALAGNLSQVDVRALVRNLFGDIPAGAARTARPTAALTSRSRVLRLPGIPAPRGVVGVIAPALEDSLHPAFYLNTLLVGSHLTQTWRTGRESSQSVYHYAVFDEPDLVRVFPPLASDVTATDALAAKVNQSVSSLQSMLIARESYQDLQTGALWLLGGPMRPTIAQRSRREPMLLHSLARSMASRELWQGDVFWKDYRERFASQTLGDLSRWVDYYKDPQHQVVLLVLPESQGRSSR